MSGMEKLRALESTGNHVFHGSPDGTIKILEPRQGRHTENIHKPKNIMLDGDPAVSATPYAELAAFRAIINDKNVPFNHVSGFGVTDGIPEFRVSHQEVLTEVKGKSGHVYVFNKDEFKPYNRNGAADDNSMEWRSYVPVTPTEVVHVTSEDLPTADRISITTK